MLDRAGDLQLDTYITHKGALPVKEAQKIFCQLASAVSYLHTMAICHRDLKPDNILVTSDAQGNFTKITIIDFNVAASKEQKVFDWNNPNSGNWIKGGTGLKEWSAPETRSRLYYNVSSDVWSLGCLLYFMLTAKQPFNKGTTI